ncbi:MAG: hypothetical protein R3E13_09965 [Alphaproteobacteria bacterium]
MGFTVFKILFSACLIAFSSWLAGKRPELAGFILALPIMTMMALPFNFAEYQDPENTVTFAKSILLAVPLSMMFFIPFLFANKIMSSVPEAYGFWSVYGLGLVCLTVAYFIHHNLTKLL